MKKLLTAIFAILSFVFSNSTLATTTSEVVPKNLHIYSASGSTYVDLTPAGCSRSRYYLDPKHVKYDAIFAILLAAQTAGKKVQVRFDKCVNGSNPQGNIVGVYLKG